MNIIRTLFIIGGALAMPHLAAAQRQMTVTLNNGKTVTIPLSDIKDIHLVKTTLSDAALAAYRQFAGEWHLVAQPMGGVTPEGIATSSPVSIALTATLPPADSDDYGRYLYCHVPTLFTSRTGQSYDANLRLAFSYDNATGGGTIALVLSQDEPVSEREFTGEPVTSYLENGAWYWGVDASRTDTGHRYLYLLSENIATSQLEGMTLPCSWTADDLQQMSTHAFIFPQTYQLYGVVGLDRPFSYAAHSTVGYVEIWASARLVRSL